MKLNEDLIVKEGDSFFLIEPNADEYFQIEHLLGKKYTFDFFRDINEQIITVTFIKDIKYFKCKELPNMVFEKRNINIPNKVKKEISTEEKIDFIYENLKKEKQIEL